MTAKLQNIFKLLGYTIIGGLCAFAWSFLGSLFLPKEVNLSVAFNLLPALLAIVGAVVALLFLKNPKRIPVLLFFVGFIFINKFFEGVIASLIAK
ncbi:MAG: hypothetical protein WCV85_06765 [Patescibacteria group bacterium]|jgi:hypothetical protein